MKLDLVFNNATANKQYGRGFFLPIIKAALDELGLNRKPLGLSINLVSSSKIRSLNKNYRGKNKTTDVLAFPLTAQNTSGLRATRDIIDLGDIFICLATVRSRATADREELDLKLAFLSVHGLLHLLGYDHAGTMAEKVKMFNLQKRILAKLF